MSVLGTCLLNYISLSFGINFRKTGNKNSLILSLQKLFKELKTSQYEQKTKIPPLHLTKPFFQERNLLRNKAIWLSLNMTEYLIEEKRTSDLKPSQSVWLKVRCKAHAEQSAFMLLTLQTPCTGWQRPTHHMDYLLISATSWPFDPWNLNSF